MDDYKNSAWWTNIIKFDFNYSVEIITWHAYAIEIRSFFYKCMSLPYKTLIYNWIFLVFLWSEIPALRRSKHSFLPFWMFMCAYETKRRWSLAELQPNGPPFIFPLRTSNNNGWTMCFQCRNPLVKKEPFLRNIGCCLIYVQY